MHTLPDEEAWASACAGDGEFQLAARHWNGGLQLTVGERSIALQLEDGRVKAGKTADDAQLIGFSAEESVWEKILREIPPPYFNDTMANISLAQGLERSGDALTHAQYYAAAMRAIELLRSGDGEGAPLAGVTTKQFDAPIGRYVHLDLDGHDHRIYFEEAGEGIPLLMQHTAGCHGSQWRHLFEVPEITSRFRLIAYDLPFHGKSIPPVGKDWWAQRYDLKGEFLRSIPLRLTQALALEDPVFMGCSVGGLLALDLAFRHPDVFRAVISVEGALKVEGSLEAMQELWHPQVSNEYKARAMEGLMSPNSPKALRKETGFVYASGWPPAFIGDLYYYVQDFDLRNAAASIDTGRCAVHILSGEYDWSATTAMGREAHEAIPGSTWAEMKGVGHFPMSENPKEFIKYLLPVLDRV
ncbi:MAG: alpha/beta hydrolase [Pseudomonadales bacterium]|nr:alpha/beta hydrolase [Pseudomonadales bacterium]MDP6472256.1 alpha/beta hydrolase [Pseudomonadales bacterium]MDP6826492.1 alpha/beta hydrolase [Pseudomonadales bacterium]